jgi:FtsP/CotA-like multicopper oxidase with cupredoxin domain
LLNILGFRFRLGKHSCRPLRIRTEKNFMNARTRVALLAFLTFGVPAALRACPWCKKYGVKETVSAGQPDPGGKFFGAAPPPEKTRHYYVAAEPGLWTFAPLGVNTSKPLPLPPDLVEHPSAAKVRYLQYTDATFSTRVLDNPRLGITGPVLRGVTGEYIAVTFLNKSGKPLSMHPHGVRYDKDSEGAYSEPGTGKGSAVGPGATFTYVWHLDELSGPQPGEPSSKCWLYHSHCTDDEEVNLGLFGFIVVTDPARARPDGTPNDVDREMMTMFYMFDETPEDEALEYADADLPKPFEPRPLLKTLELREVSVRPSINGMLFGNLPGLQMRSGERVRWYLGTLGEDDGMHTAHWHGARVREEGRRVCDVITLLPGETKVADQIADAPGSWLLHCHVSDHMMEGMFANYVVLPASASIPPDPFPGVASSVESLRWVNAETGMHTTDEGASVPSVTLKGKVAVYRGFFPQRNPPTIRAAGKEIAFAFRSRTTATGEFARWQVSNANAQGVVADEVMDFEVTLTGEEWRKALTSSGQNAKTIPIEVQIGGVVHKAGLQAPRAVAEQPVPDKNPKPQDR